MKPIEWTTEAPPGGGEMTLEQREYINALRRRIEAQNALAESLVGHPGAHRGDCSPHRTEGYCLS